MTDPDDEYGQQMDRIQERLEAFEGHGPPDNEELLSVAKYETDGCLGVIESIEDCDDPELIEEFSQTLKGDVLKIRVALDMARGVR